MYILTRNLPEAAERKVAPIKEEKKRWWQMLLGKGENFLRSIRVLLLKFDNRLNESIKKVRKKKDIMELGIREYRKKYRQKFTSSRQLPNNLDSSQTSGLLFQEEKQTRADFAGVPEKEISKQDISSPNLENQKQGKISQVPKLPPAESETAPKKSRAVEEIIKRTFTPTEIKVETQQYWKKKEEMLIQSIVRDPKNVNLYLQLGRLYSNQHNWRDARNAFSEVLKIDKTNIKAKEELKRIEKYLGEI